VSVGLGRQRRLAEVDDEGASTDPGLEVPLGHELVECVGDRVARHPERFGEIPRRRELRARRKTARHDRTAETLFDLPRQGTAVLTVDPNEGGGGVVCGWQRRSSGIGTNSTDGSPRDDSANRASGFAVGGACA
jgi:hypothetical protein